MSNFSETFLMKIHPSMDMNNQDKKKKNRRGPILGNFKIKPYDIVNVKNLSMI